MNLKNGPLLSDILQDFMNWCSSKPAKGFEKFYRDKPKGKQPEAPKRKEKARRLTKLSWSPPGIASRASNVRQQLILLSLLGHV